MLLLVLLAGLAVASEAPEWREPGRILDVVFDPADDEIAYVLTANEGVLRTTEGGDSWVRCEGGARPFNALAIQPLADGRLFVAADACLYTSDDSGQHWTRVSDFSGLAREGESRCLTVDPTAPSTLYAGLNAEVGVIRSDDGGRTWSSSGASDLRVHEIVMGPSPAHTMLAAGLKSYPSLDQRSYHQLLRSAATIASMPLPGSPVSRGSGWSRPTPTSIWTKAGGSSGPRMAARTGSARKPAGSPRFAPRPPTRTWSMWRARAGGVPRTGAAPSSAFLFRSRST